jgi:hypothetical protein
MRPLVIVDGANVVGSVPDGWWRDRLGAARRLRDALAPLAAGGFGPGGPAGVTPPLEVLLVVEGVARPLAAEEGGPASVTVRAAGGSGDDAIVGLLRERAELAEGTAAESARTCVVVTADRGLRDRVHALGGVVVGPRSLPHLRAGR